MLKYLLLLTLACANLSSGAPSHEKTALIQLKELGEKVEIKASSISGEEALFDIIKNDTKTGEISLAINNTGPLKKLTLSYENKTQLFSEAHSSSTIKILKLASGRPIPSLEKDPESPELLNKEPLIKWINNSYVLYEEFNELEPFWEKYRTIDTQLKIFFTKYLKIKPKQPKEKCIIATTLVILMTAACGLTLYFRGA